MRDDMRPLEIRILKILIGVEKPIGGKDLMERLDYRSPTNVGFHLERLENKGLLAPRRPYQRHAIILTEAGKAAAAAFARKEAAA